MKNDKTNKKNEDKKYKIVLRKIINIFCYVVTGISLFLGVLVGISQCSAKDHASFKQNKQYSFANTELRSSFGNFDFIPYSSNQVRSTDVEITGDSRFGTYDSGRAYFDMFSITPNGQSYKYFLIQSDEFVSGVQGYQFTIFYNGTRYASNHISVFGDHFTYYSSSTGYTVVNTTQPYQVYLAMRCVSYSDVNTMISNTFKANINDYRFNWYQYCVYYCSFNDLEMSELVDSVITSPTRTGLLNEIVCNYVANNFNYEKRFENYFYDDSTYVLNPFYTPDVLNVHVPYIMREYHDQSYDELQALNYICGGFSYNVSHGYYCYSWYDLTNGAYDSGELPLASLQTNRFGYTFLDIGQGFTINKTDTPWYYCFYYYVFTMRGHFPKTTNNLNYKGCFLPLEVSAITYNLTFTVNSQSMMDNYTMLTGEANTMKNYFRGASFLYLTDQTFVGFMKNAQYFTYMSNYSFQYPEGMVTTIGNANTSTLRKVSTNRIDVNDLLFFLDSSYEVDYVRLPIDPDIDNPDTIEVISETFNLFSMAFTSMVAFFNFKIGATLTLGTLILIPLIATLIFFVVRLFKR